MNLIAVMRARRRLVDVGVVAFCLALLGYALFLQYYRGLDPCPLCLFQRIAIIGLTVAYFLAALVADRWRAPRVVVSVLIGLVALAWPSATSTSSRCRQARCRPAGRRSTISGMCSP
jgi:disulfide bond formation protein DsbB